MLKIAIRDHHKVCATCYRYRPNASRYCGEGYDLSCELAAAEDDVRRLTPESQGPGLTLF